MFETSLLKEGKENSLPSNYPFRYSSSGETKFNNFNAWQFKFAVLCTLFIIVFQRSIFSYNLNRRITRIHQLEGQEISCNDSRIIYNNKVQCRENYEFCYIVTSHPFRILIRKRTHPIRSSVPPKVRYVKKADRVPLFFFRLRYR